MNCVNEAGNTLPLDQFNTKEISFAINDAADWTHGAAKDAADWTQGALNWRLN